MPGLTKDPKLVVYDLLVAGWNPANTSGITPRFHTGNFNHSWKAPQVTVTDASEFPSGGGETGFRAIDSAGKGVKTMIGTVVVGCYSHDNDGSNQNPRKLSYEMSEEVKRIIKVNMLPGGDMQVLSWLGRLELVDPDVEDVLFWYDNTVSYIYIDRV